MLCTSQHCHAVARTSPAVQEHGTPLTQMQVLLPTSRHSSMIAHAWRSLIMVCAVHLLTHDDGAATAQVLLPYLKAKCDSLYAKHSHRSGGAGVLGLALARSAQQQEHQVRSW